MYIAPGWGRQPTGDKNLMTTERPFLFARMLQVSKWSLRNLILYTFVMTLYIYLAPGQGQKTPWDKLLMSTECPYHFDHLLQVSNKSLWILILYTFFNVSPHVQCRWKNFPFLFFSPWTIAFFSRRNSKKLLPEEKNIALKRSRFHRETLRHFTAKIDFSRRKKSWVQVSTGRPICTDSPCFSAKFCGVEFNG